MSKYFSESNQLAPVWPDPNGPLQGVAVQPLYPSVPKAAKQNAELYDLLAMVDALRMGRARERKLAEEQLRERLNLYAIA